MYKISDFCLKVFITDGVILKSNRTGAIIKLNMCLYEELLFWLKNQENAEPPGWVDDLAGDNGILVSCSDDEYEEWRVKLLAKRNDKAHIFTLHFEPTIQCQLECSYCFENGADRGTGMTAEILARSAGWLDEYFEANPEVDSLKVVLFGGEPLLRKDIASQGLELYAEIAKRRHLNFWTEITTNGELLDEETAKNLSRFNWNRVQITLDGPEDVHDTRRHGKHQRPTFRNIMRNIEMLLCTGYVPAVDIRITLDQDNADSVPVLVTELARFGKQGRINLSLGLTTSTFFVQIKSFAEHQLADTALKVWRHAKDSGFRVPEEFIVGPLCVATAKHSATLQPDGMLQKCFCNSGRNDHGFASVQNVPTGYAQDVRFEGFTKRTDQCVDEKCPHLPICGGGCTHNSLVQLGEIGFSKRYCQKTLLTVLNEGLIRLNHA